MSEKAVVQHSEGTVLFEEGEEGSEMYVVKSGRVRLDKRIHRTDVAIETLGAGAFCGELALINEQPRPVTATVVQNASLIQIEADQFEAMVRKNPDIALRMLKKMGQRLTEAQYRLSNMVLRTSEGRLIHQLREEAERAGDTEEPTSKAPLPDDLDDALAREVGGVKEQLNTLLERDLIDVDDRGYFEILDIDGFDRYLSYLELGDRFEYTET
jgi:CRP-like cAMP-binding protein